MALSDFQDELRYNIKRDTDGVSDARLTRWLNWSQIYIADLHTYEEMHYKDTSKATTADDNSLTWSTRMKDLYSITVQDGARSQKLTYVPAREFDSTIPRPLTYSTDIPKFYVDYGSTFELFPIPDAAYDIVLRVSQYPEDLSAAADESDLLRKDALITAVATVFGFMSLREVDDAAYWGSEIVPVLYASSLKGDHSYEDWTPIARGFGNTGGVSLSGQWWLNPFAGR